MISKTFSEEHHYRHVKIAKCLYLISVIPHSYTRCFALYQTPWIWVSYVTWPSSGTAEGRASGRSDGFYKTMRTLEVI